MLVGESCDEVVDVLEAKAISPTPDHSKTTPAINSQENGAGLDNKKK